MASKPVSFCDSYGSYDALTGVYTSQTRDEFMVSLTADIARAVANMAPIDLGEPAKPEAKAEPVPEAKAPKAKPEEPK